MLAQSLSQDASASLSLFDRRGKHLKYTLQVDSIVLFWHFSFQLQLSMYPPLAAPLFRTCETSNPTSKGGSVKHDTATTRALIITPIRHHCTRVWDVRYSYSNTGIHLASSSIQRGRNCSLDSYRIIMLYCTTHSLIVGQKEEKAVEKNPITRNNNSLDDVCYY